MPTFKIQFLKKEVIAFKTKSFYFSKPLGFNFKSGQYGKFTLINPPKSDLKGNTRSFSISSSPQEQYLMISIRLRNSAYKQVLDSLSLEAELELLGPLSMFRLPRSDTKPIVFLTGGIGVAAARPMIFEAIENSFANQIFLFNSNRHFRDIPYFSEFKQLSLKNDNFTYIPNITKKDPTWTGEKNYLTLNTLKKYLKDPFNVMYYLAGPPKFIWGMYKILKDLGVKESHINFDEFTGY